jgi:hypothetical protein
VLKSDTSTQWVFAQHDSVKSTAAPDSPRHPTEVVEEPRRAAGRVLDASNVNTGAGSGGGEFNSVDGTNGT